MLAPEYVAGFFDGEGCCSLIYSKRRPWKSDPTKTQVGFRFMCGISNTHRGVLEMLHKQYGGNLTPYDSASKRFVHDHYKKVWDWRLTSSNEQRRFLAEICPLSVIKKRQIELALSYLDTVGMPGHRVSRDAWTRRLEIFEEMRLLNRRGKEKSPTHTPPLAPPDGWNPRSRRYSEQELKVMMDHVRSGRRHVTKE